MEKIILLLAVKYKMFLYGLITGAVMYVFEVQVGNIKFNFGKFIVSSVIFGFLTEFCHLLVQGEFIEGNLENESRTIAISIIGASLLYLFIPFILKKENRKAFIISVLSKFGFEQNGNKELEKED